MKNCIIVDVVLGDYMSGISSRNHKYSGFDREKDKKKVEYEEQKEEMGKEEEVKE